MENAKHAIKNSKGQYAGAGSEVILLFDSGKTFKGTIKSIRYATDIVFSTDIFFNVNHIVDFILV